MIDLQVRRRKPDARVGTDFCSWIGPTVVAIFAALQVVSAPTASTDIAVPDSRDAELGAFNVDLEYFFELVKRVAVEPTTAWHQLGLSQQDLEALDRRFVDELRIGGFEVVEPRVWADIWLEMSEHLGGSFDQRSGAPIPGAYDLVREFTLRELGRRHAVDAVLSATIYSTRSTDAHAGPRLDPLIWEGDVMRGHPMGIDWARVHVAIRDTNDRDLYGLWTRIAWVGYYVNQSYVERPPSENAAFAAQLEDAIRSSMYYLTGGEYPVRHGWPHKGWAVGTGLSDGQSTSAREGP